MGKAFFSSGPQIRFRRSFHCALAIASLGLAVAMVPSAIAAKTGKKKTVTVASDGTGDFTTVQAAVDSAGPGGLVIKIKPGTYKQKISIETPGVELRGLGADPKDVVLTYDTAHRDVNSTSKSASVTVDGDDFYAQNLTFQNTFSMENPTVKENAQAVALRVTGDRAVFRHVRMIGMQDTLYADSKTCHTDTHDKIGACVASRQYYADCYIEGHVDFIFGDAKAVFDRCEIHGIAHSMVTYTAQSKHNPDEDSGYVFIHCRLTADPGAQRIYLGRPWRDYSTVIFLNTRMDAPVDPAGWLEWSAGPGTSRLATSMYAEYRSTGIGANPSKRSSYSHQLTAAEAAKYETKAFLAGPDGWNPTKIH